MEELVTYEGENLPAKPEDLAKFIIVAQEKINSVKAEIRAIKRLQMAKEVYDQKLGEMRELQAVTLLAHERMGEITREIPKDVGGRPKETSSTSATSFGKRESKEKVVNGLGLSKFQVSRMERMAAHPEIVDEVIQDARDGKVEATQTEVLRRIKEKEQIIVEHEPEPKHECDEQYEEFCEQDFQRKVNEETEDDVPQVIDLQEVRKELNVEEMRKIDTDYDNLEIFHNAIGSIQLFEITDDVLDSVAREDYDLSDTLRDIDMIISRLSEIKAGLVSRRARNGKRKN